MLLSDPPPPPPPSRETSKSLNSKTCFEHKYRVSYINLLLIYYRFYKSYLFSSVALNKTTIDQNVETTLRNPIHYPFWHQGFWYPHQAPRGGGGGGLEMDHHKYLKKGKCYKPETLGGVRYPSRSPKILS